MTTTKTNHVVSITPASSGFGQSQRGEAVPCEWETAAEYVAGVLSENSNVFDGHVDGDDGDTELQSAIDASRDAVAGGHGTLVAFRDQHGEIAVESFEN